MGTLNALVELVVRTLNDWRAGAVGDLVFTSKNAALVGAALLAVAAASVFAWRSIRGRLAGRTAVALPAVLPRGAEKPSATHRARLALAEAAGAVLAGGLSLLGIDAPEHL